MNAHQLDANGVIINTIVVDSLDQFPNLADASIGGSIGDSIINGVLIPKAAPAPAVPTSITMRQARLALLGAGLLSSVNSAIAAMTGPAGVAAQIAWEYSSDVLRYESLTINMGASLGLTSAQIDALFIKAASL